MGPELCHVKDFQISAQESVSLSPEKSKICPTSGSFSPILGPNRPKEWDEVRCVDNDACLLSPGDVEVEAEAEASTAAAASDAECRKQQGSPPLSSLAR